MNLSDQLDTLEYQKIKTRSKVTYINLPCGFDIETTSHKIDGEKLAFMYVWMLGIGHNEHVHYGRTWAEFLEACEMISDKLDLSEDKRLVIYVHNLSYEFQFMYKYFSWLDVFAVSDRKPIKALCSLGIEFRDSYILSGYSLANTAKNLTSHTIDKMEGDLDYSLIRHHETELTPEEKGYCDNDIHIITAYIQEQIDLYGDVSKIPMTNTGRVRKHVRNECYYQPNVGRKKASRSKYFRYRKVMEDLTLTAPIYTQLKRGFMGGFTHANAMHSGKKLEGVTSIDFTSSYPSVMVSEKFPMSKFRKANVKSIEKLDEFCYQYAVIMDVKFINIRSSIPQENYMSESKCFTLVKPEINNGRIAAAEEMAVTITDVDYEIMKQVYDWDSIQLGEVRYAHKDYLPKAIVKSILDLYQKKTELKDVEGYEVEYLLSKGMLNSIYGMCVTDIVKDQAIFNGEWTVEPVDIEEEIANYNESKNRFLYYPWGLWVTAYARMNLWTGILAVGEDYVYSDTDSLKILNYEDHQGYIKWFNDTIITKMQLMCAHYGFDVKLLSPKTKQGKTKTLGIWDYEGTYGMFKTLGAKRYMSEENGKIAITVAGLSKQNGVNYMREQANNDVEKVFDMFTDELYIPADRTGKMTHTYIDQDYKFKVTDYNGKEATVETLSGVHLEACEFTLSIADHYKQFISELSHGYIYKGVNHV